MRNESSSPKAEWTLIVDSFVDDCGYPIRFSSIVPAYGKDHVIHGNCWCDPELRDGIMYHKASN